MPGSTLSTETDFFKNLPPIREMGDYESLPASEVGTGETTHVESERPASTEGSEPELAGGQSEQGNADLPAARSLESPSGEQPAGQGTVTEQRPDGDQTDLPQLTPEQVSALQSQADQWESLSSSYAQNPIVFVQSLLANLTPTQQQAALAELAPQQQPAGYNPNAPYAPPAPTYQQQYQVPAFRPDGELTAEELYVKNTVAPQMQQMQQVAQQAAALPQFQQQVSQALQMRDSYLSEMAFQLARANAQITALTEANEMKLPDIDRASIDRLVRSGQSYEQAIASTYLPKASQVAKTAAAAKKPTPTTPMNGAGETPAAELSKDAPMIDVFRQVEQEFARRTRR